MIILRFLVTAFMTVFSIAVFVGIYLIANYLVYGVDFDFAIGVFFGTVMAFIAIGFPKELATMSRGLFGWVLFVFGAMCSLVFLVITQNGVTWHTLWGVGASFAFMYSILSIGLYFERKEKQEQAEQDKVYYRFD